MDLPTYEPNLPNNLSDLCSTLHLCHEWILESMAFAWVMSWFESMFENSGWVRVDSIQCFESPTESELNRLNLER